jgi:MoxR-like ATPase
MKLIETKLTEKISRILNSDTFFPTLVVGPTRCGKTFPIIELCKKMNLDYIRVNLTNETDESTLMGNYKLEDGNTIFNYGPVVVAMKEGKVLILDEIDSSNPANIMCLQSVLEGDGYYIKRTKEYIEPHPNFKVFATANTKGKGDNTGNYVTANILNEAFLERFVMYIETDYQNETIEKKIINANIKVKDKTLLSNFVKWANKTRKHETITDFQIESPITTGRLIAMFKIASLFELEDPIKILSLSLDRYEDYQKDAYIKLYESMFDVRKDPQNNGDSNSDPDFNNITPF